ncbi:MAG: enoyl-CoA hydratase/isomerase family protein [Pyrinomonadaceae bacterium]
MLIIERRKAVLLLTLNRPEKRNSLSPDLISLLAKTLTVTKDDELLNVVVITGAGSSFCAGLDLMHLLSLDVEGKVAYLQTAFALFQQIYTLPQPVIAAINGPAMAGGFELAAHCDLRMCAPEARFAQTEILLGLTQIMYPLYKVIGLGRAKELALTGEAISAEEAHRIGLVNHVYPRDELLDRALKLAQSLADKPRQALFETKRLSRELIELDEKSALKRMFEAISERIRSEEHTREVEKYVERLGHQK